VASSSHKGGFSRWIIRSLLLGSVLEVGFLLGGLELLGLKFGESPIQKFHQELKQAEKLVSQTVESLKGEKGGQQAMNDLVKLSEGESLKGLEQVSRADIERNPFALPKGIHTLKELEDMARKSEEGASTKDGVKRSELKVSGIFLGNRERTAIVGGILVREGDLVGAEQVFEINREGVVLEKEGNKRTLTPPALVGWLPAGDGSPLLPEKKAQKKTKSSKRRVADD
jgi:hypothetical protein